MLEHFSLRSRSNPKPMGSTANIRVWADVELEKRIVASNTPVAADFSSATNYKWMNQIKVDGTNLLQGSGFHMIGSLGTADDNNNVASESSQNYTNANGVHIMRPYAGSTGGSVPYSFLFDKNTGDASKIKFSVSVGKSANSFQVMNIPLEANLKHFTYFRYSGSSGYHRFDQIGNGTPSYTKPTTGNFYIQTVGAQAWGELVGPKYTIRITVTPGPNSPVSLGFVNAPGLGGGIRDVEFGFHGGLPAQQQRTLSGVIQVFRTDQALLPTRTYQAETNPYSLVGTPNGDGRYVTANQSGYMHYGPYLQVDKVEGVGFNSNKLVAGGHRATFRLLVDNNTANNNRLLTIDVYTPGGSIKKLDITRRMFNAANTYQNFTLDFDAQVGQNLEFRVFSWGGSYVKLDKVTLS